MTVTHCAVCHRLLTDPYSVAVGVGPECRGKYPKHHFPKPVWRVRHGRVELVDLIPQGNPLPASPKSRADLGEGKEGTDDDEETETEEG